MPEQPLPPEERSTTTPSSPRTAGSDWATARGDKWGAELPRMEATLEPVNEPLIHALDLQAPCRIADIGCGGGGVALEILRRAPAGSVVHGFDISPALIELARQRAAPGERMIAFETADMSKVAPPEGPYDRLVSRFGIMFFDDAPNAFANLVRWLAPGGRFAFAVWGPVADNPWMTSVRDATAEVVNVPAADPEAPGAFRYAEVDKLFTLLERVGFGELDARSWRGELAIGGGLAVAEATRFALASFASFSELLAEAGDEALGRARQSLAARFSRHEHDGTVRMAASVHIVTGMRPGTRRSVT